MLKTLDWKADYMETPYMHAFKSYFSPYHIFNQIYMFVFIFLNADRKSINGETAIFI